MTDAFNNELHINDIVYFCSLDNPRGTYRTPCRMYKGVIINLSDCYATIEVRNESNGEHYKVKKIWNKIGLLKHQNNF